MIRGASWTVVLGAVAALLFAGPAGTHPFAPDRARLVVFLTKPVSAVQGSVVRATVVVSRAVPRCSGTVLHGRTGSTKIADVFRLRASFAWQLPAAATPGLWRIAVSCGRAGSASGSFKVTKKPPPPVVPTVAVDKAGFGTTGTALGYGVVLRNSSTDQAALGVTVTVNVVDASNRILKADSSRLTGIPAATTYYLGGEVSLDAGSVPANLQVNVTVEAGQANRLTLPAVANLRATADASGATHVQGEFINPYIRPMSSFTRISSVVFDPGGNVIGGSVTFPSAPIAPNDRFAFDMPVAGVTLDRIGTVQASIEPELG